MQNPGKFFLTTPIYYVNARPHLGHTYTTVAADAIARHKRMLGCETWFLTGTDEHGQKIERSSKAARKSPSDFAGEISAEFRGLWDRMGLAYDDYIRTTDERHKKGVQKLFSALKERGFIYKGTYTGQYCIHDELYVDAPPGAPCPDCGRITETVNEDNYFFKLSAFERRLLELYEEHPDFIRPETRRNEVVSFVRSGLKDLSISRTGFTWGIPVPGDERHVIYVWMDALANYITAIGYGSDDPADITRFEKLWPADLHLIGKEISRFHCVYWPAFLLAAGLPLPRAIVAHGWLLFEQNKMSKSRGNIVRAETILDVLGADALRYFLLREIVFGQDGSFSFDALVQRYNADLANGYGNLVSRTLAMVGKYFGGVFPNSDLPLPDAERVAELATSTIDSFHKHFEAYEFSRALESVWALIAAVDGFITEAAPWKLGGQVDTEPGAGTLLARILYIAAESIRIITALVYPVIPDAAARVWSQLGLGHIAQADLRSVRWGGLAAGARVGQLSPVFPRAEKDAIQRMTEAEEQRNAARTSSVAAPSTAADAGARSDAAAEAPLEVAAEIAQQSSTQPAATENAPAPNFWVPKVAPAGVDPATAVHSAAPASSPSSQPGNTVAFSHADRQMITIDDFSRVDLRVAQIKVAERIPKADKLLRLEVDLGYEQRQILAGIAEHYDPATLVGRKVVIVANLQPRKMRGLESNGMIVAASIGEKGAPVLAGFLEDVEIGARLK